MAETFRIEIPIDAIDRTGPGFTAASQRVSRFEQQMARSERQLRRMNQTRWQVTLQALDRATPVITKVNAALARATSRTWRIGMTVVGLPGRMLNSLFSLPTVLAGLAGAGAVQGGIMWPLELAGNLEQSRIAFETMLGSAERANQFLGELQTFAVRTPFDLPGLQDASKRLLAFGFAVDQILPMLTAVGNAAAGLGAGTEGINRITLALGQMRARGKVSAEEVNQLTDVGVGGWAMLAEAMGVTEAQAMKLAEQGLIPADKAIQSIVDGMNRKFPNMMERQSRSILGLGNAIKEVFQTRIITSWGDGIRSAVQPRLQALVDWFDLNDDVVRRWQDTLQQAGATVANWVLDKVEHLQQRLSELSQSEVWQQADVFGKLKLLWDDVIVKPFMEWWNGEGRDRVNAIAQEIGAAMAAGIGAAITSALPAILREAGKVAPGGERATTGSWLAALGIGAGSLWLAGKGLGLARLLSGLFGAGAAATGAGAAATAASGAAGLATAADLVQILGPNGQVLSTVARLAGGGAAAAGPGAASAGTAAIGSLAGIGAWLGGIAAAVWAARKAAPYLPGTGAYADRQIAEQYAQYATRGKLGQIPTTISAPPALPWWQQTWASPWVFLRNKLGEKGIDIAAPFRGPSNLTVEYRPEIRIEASATNAEDVLRILREHGEEVADDVAGAIAVRLGPAWANM